MVLTVGEELDSFDGFIPVIGIPWSTLVMLLESSTDKGLANVRYTLITKVMREFKPVVLGLIQALTLEKLEPLRVPCAPIPVSLRRAH
jgi:hypothetical protein